MKYLEHKGVMPSRAEINRLVRGCSGVKRTDRQHPGGMGHSARGRTTCMFFTPYSIRRQKDSGVVTTHFDFDSLHDRLVKLDILGHDAPTILGCSRILRA